MLAIHRLGVAALLCLIFVAPSAARAADKWEAPKLAAGRSNYLNSYRPVSAVRSGNVVTLSGLLKNKQLGNLATLPPDMRPAQQVIFDVNVHDHSARIDVLPNGEVHMAAGYTGYGWVSLDGISFPVGRGQPLKLEHGWRNYGGAFAGANASLEGDTVFVGGLVVPGNDRVIAKLPPNMRPSKALIFNVQGFNQTARVDVYPDGSIIAIQHVAGAKWVSLNGITFERKPGKPLRLAGGWRNYGQQYAPVTVTRTGNRISVSGLAKASSSRWGQIATLPKGMCPKERLIFDLNNHERSSRVDVLADCRIYWIGGGHDHGWLSLDGIAFYLKSVAPTATAGATPTARTGGGVRAPAASQSSTPTRTAKGNTLIKDAKAALGSLGEMAGPLRNGINSLINTYNHLLVEDGELLSADITVAGKTVTVVIYRPIAGQPRVNIAVMTKPGQSLKVSDFLAIAGRTPADDLQLVNAAYIFVPQGNAQDSVNVSSLPAKLRTQVQRVRTGAIRLLAGQNIFATINTKDNGTTAKLLKLVGVSLGDLKVHIGYGRQANGDPFKAIRLTRAGNWNKPFHLVDTVFTDATLDLSQHGNEKMLRGWGTATLKNKPYFLFVQKSGATGPYPTAAAVDARSISLEDYKNIVEILGDTVFGAPPDMKAKGQLKAMLNGLASGLDKLPLDKVTIENPHYAPGGALDADNNPVFDNVLVMTASPADTLPDAKTTHGPAIVAHGKGKVFGVSVANIDARVTKDNGMDIDADAGLPNWGPLKLGTFKFALSKGDTWYSYDMYLRGKATVSAGPVTFSGEDITIRASKTGFAFELGQQCPRRPVGVKAKASTLVFGSGPGFDLKAVGNPMDCVLAVGEALNKAAGEVANVSKAAYDASHKQVEKQLKNIGHQAEKAAKWVTNKISGAFGRKKKSKPSSPSYEELRKLDCSKNLYAGYVLWQDACPRNWADRQWENLAKQSSTLAPDRHPCVSQQQIQVLESLLDWEQKQHVNTTDTQSQLDRARELAKKMCETDYRADRAQDGNEDTFAIAGSRFAKNAWWELDLGGTAPLHTVVVYGDKEDPKQLDGLIVAISATVHGEQMMWDQSGAVKRFVLSSGVMSIVDIRDSVQTAIGMALTATPVRYVRIYRAGYGQIKIGEVQLFGPAGVKLTRP